MNRPKPGPPRQRLMVYVDGFNLYHGMHDAFGHSTLWLDLVKLGQSLRPKQRLVGVRYFSAPVLNDPGAQGRQAHYLEALGAKHPHTFSSVMGRYQARDITCFKCGHKHVKHEEKETDVNIAASLIYDAAMHEMDTAIIVSADSDLAPAVRAAMKLHPPLFIAAAFPPKRFSSELKALMPASFKIGDSKIRQAQLPQTFTVEGDTFTRPAKWVK